MSERDKAYVDQLRPRVWDEAAPTAEPPAPSESPGLRAPAPNDPIAPNGGAGCCVRCDYMFRGVRMCCAPACACHGAPAEAERPGPECAHAFTPFRVERACTIHICFGCGTVQTKAESFEGAAAERPEPSERERALEAALRGLTTQATPDGSPCFCLWPEHHAPECVAARRALEPPRASVPGKGEE